MATGKGSMTHAEVHSVCNGLECSPSKGQASSPVHKGKRGGKKSGGFKKPGKKG